MERKRDKENLQQFVQCTHHRSNHDFDSPSTSLRRERLSCLPCRLAPLFVVTACSRCSRHERWRARPGSVVEGLRRTLRMAAQYKRYAPAKSTPALLNRR